MKLRPYSHPGKFEGGLMIDQYTYALLQADTNDSIGGHDYPLWFGLLLGSLYAPHDDASVENELAAQFDLTEDELAFLHVQAGAIVTETDQGFVTVTYYDDEYKLNQAWQEIVVSLPV